MTPWFLKLLIDAVVSVCYVTKAKMLIFGKLQRRNNCTFVFGWTVLRFIATWRSNYAVSQKTSHLCMVCYNFDTHEWILIFFNRNVTDKVGNQKTLYYATSNNLCFCTTWQNVETLKSHISLNWIVLHTMHLCAIFLEEIIVTCDVFDSV